MDEFLKLILTGERLQKLKRFDMMFKISAVAEFVFALPLLFTASPSVPAAVSIVFGILLIAFGLFGAGLSFVRTKLCKNLVGEQIFAEEFNADEAGKARKSLAENYAKFYNNGISATVIAVLGLIPVIVYLAASVLSVLVNLQVTEYSYIVPVLYIIATVCTVIIAFIPAIRDGKARAALYESCDGEITLLKRNAGFAEYLIKKQSYNAKNTATRSQELFLRDPADKVELRRLFSVMGYCALALAIAFVAVLNALGFMSEHFDDTFMAVSSSCLIAAVLLLWIATAVWIEIRRRAIYRRNAAKLTDSEPDRLRRLLQNEYIKLQRKGNIFFSLFCGIPTVAGFILGALGAVNDPEISFIENASGMAFVFFLISAILAFIIWSVIYAVYRNKVKPVEMQLGNMSENYGKTN